jgi:hypothetical protein
MLDAVASGALGEDLIEQGTAAAIREMRLRAKSKTRIATELDLDIKTVRKWSSEAGDSPSFFSRYRLFATQVTFTECFTCSRRSCLYPLRRDATLDNLHVTRRLAATSPGNVELFVSR